MDQQNRFPARFVQPAFTAKNSFMPMAQYKPGLKAPPIFYYNLDDPQTEKKWRGPKEDITDYFNYGFTEDAWKLYAEKVQKLAEKSDKPIIPPAGCAVLNDRVPLELGGFGDPQFQEVAKLPFLDILRKNKERFFFQYFQQSRFEGDEVKNQLHAALSSDQAEECYDQVKEAYDAVSPGLLQLKHKLMPQTPVTIYRSRAAYGNPGGPQPRPSLNPLKDPALANIGLPRSSVQKPPEVKSITEELAALFELTAGHQALAAGRDEGRSKPPKRQERDRSPRREKKKKEKRDSSRSRSRDSYDRKKKDRKRSKERRRRDEESREKKKKHKKSEKETHSRQSPLNYVPQLPKNDIRQRIQPRANR